MAARTEQTGRVSDPSALLDGVEAQETLCSTGIPGGLACLHSRSQESHLRGQKGPAKPPKATSRPPQSHILGIDSGVQSHLKATLKPHQGSTKATPRPPQSHTKATPKRHQSLTKATCGLFRWAGCQGVQGALRRWRRRGGRILTRPPRAPPPPRQRSAGRGSGSAAVELSQKGNAAWLLPLPAERGEG